MSRGAFTKGSAAQGSFFAGVELAVPAIAFAFVVGAPTVAGGGSVDVPASKTAIVVGTPAVAGGGSVAVPAIKSAFLVGTPVIATSLSEVNVPAISTAFVTGLPSVAGGGSVAVPASTVAFAVAAPTAYGEIGLVEPPAVRVSFGIGAPLVGSGGLVDVPAISTAFVAGAPTIDVPTYAGVSETMAFAEGVTFGVEIASTETVDIADITNMHMILSVLERAGLTGSHVAGVSLTAGVSEQLATADAMVFAATAEITESLDLADETDVLLRIILLLQERLGLAPDDQANLTLTAGVSEQITAADIIGFAAVAEISENLGLLGAHDLLRRIVLLLQERAGLSDTVTAGLTLTAGVDEQVSTDDAIRFGIVGDLSENVDLADLTALLESIVLRMQERAGLTGSHTANLWLTTGIEESVSTVDAIRFGVIAELIESMDVADAYSLLQAIVLRMREQALLTDSHEANLWLTAGVSEHFTTADAIRFGVIAALAENLDVADTSSVGMQRLLVIAEALGLSERVGANVELTAGLSELLNVVAAQGYGLTAGMAESVELATTIQSVIQRGAAISERLGLSSTQSAAVSLYAALVESLTLRDLIASIDALSMSETVALADAIDRALLARVTTAETLALAEQMQFGLTLLVPEALGLEDSPSNSLTTTLGMSETLAFISRLALDGTEYEAWVMNTDTLGMTQYTQFPMNSLVSYNNRTYGIAETGLYLLDGSDDAGTPIDAHVRLGFMDFGTPHLKRMPRAYLHVKSDNALYLKVISERDGSRKEIWYSLGARDFDGLVTRRIKLGRGIEARHYALEVSNVDGGTLDLRDVKVLPVVLSRR